MSDHEHGSGALIPAPRPGLTAPCSISLVARGRADLRTREIAADWLRKGLECLERAPADPLRYCPENPYATGTVRARLQQSAEYTRRILGGSTPEQSAKALKMSQDDQEFAHTVYFFVPSTLASISNQLTPCLAAGNAPEPVQGSGPNETAGRSHEDVPRSRVPLPAGMEEGILTRSTMDKVGELIVECGRMDRELRERESALNEAFHCFEKGHEIDPTDSELLYRLAVSYQEGLGIGKNEEMAVALYRRAAMFGHAPAMRAVGDAYAQISFSCLPENWEEAAKWYRDAAERGDETAVWMIVECCDSGKGVPQSYVEAAQWLQKLAEQGNEDAQEELQTLAQRHGGPK